MDVISQNLNAVAKFVGMASVAQVESHIVFKNPVPMQFAMKHMAKLVSISIFDILDQL
jgi:hypothetical protein